MDWCHNASTNHPAWSQSLEEMTTDSSCLPSPVRQSVSKYVGIGLTEAQIRSSVSVDHPSTPVLSTKLTSLVQTERRNNRPEIFSVYDFRKWCNDHQDVNVELTLLVFGASDSNRHFHPFGVALVSDDESSSCYEHLFTSLQSLSIQGLHQPYSPGFIMADGVLGVTSAQQKIFPQVKRLMCWFHMIKKCREHRNLVAKQQWNEIHKEIHAVQLSFSDEVFNHGMNLLMTKWRSDTSYEGCVLNIPATNNGSESMNAKIKQQYTLRNKLHLSSFLPKIETMLGDWSKHCDTNPFSVCASIIPDCELAGYKWATMIDRNSILYWHGNFYVVPSSNAHITPSAW
ncbi:unnamed protein product, partial [Didymodactylos carnosus]